MIPICKPIQGGRADYAHLPEMQTDLFSEPGMELRALYALGSCFAIELNPSSPLVPEEGLSLEI